MSFPLHPIFVNFTAALVPISVMCDVLARLLGSRKPLRDSLRAAAWWTLLFGTIITPLTAIAGWMWLYEMGGMDMTDMTVHKWLGTSLAFLFIGLLAWRWRAHRRNEAPGIFYLVVASLVVGVLTLQGHLGGTMSFGGGPVFGGGNDAGGATAPDGHQHEHDEQANDQARLSSGEPEWRDHIDVGPTP